MTDSVWLVFWAALLTDLATGLGALPFAFLRNPSPRWQGLMGAAAGGMMISASVFGLAEHALRRGSVWGVVAGMLAGAAFFAWAARRLESRPWSIGHLSPKESRIAVLIFAAMFVHSIPEGVAIGVGYATGELRFGTLLALAIAIHNIPEGIAVSLPLRSRGISVLRCAGYAILTSAPQPILAVPSFLFMSAFQPLLPAGLGFAGGAMIFIVASELMPESLQNASKYETAWGVMVGFVLMLLLTAGMGP